MQMSRRALRMERHHKRHRSRGGLNLVSLMDIFTILVFFLLVNSAEVDVLPNPKDIQLPESVADQKARETVVVVVTDDDIIVQGRAVASVADVVAARGLVIPELKAALQQQADRVLRRDAASDIADREVTIMGDRALPYSLLRRIMASCTAANYGRLSLAVVQKSKLEGAAAMAVAREG